MMLSVQELYQLGEQEKRKTMISLNQKLAQVLNNPEEYPININFKRTITKLNRDVLSALQSEDQANKWLQQTSLLFRLTSIDPNTINTATTKQQTSNHNKKIDQPSYMQEPNVINMDKPTTLAQAIETLLKNNKILDAHIYFLEFLFNHPNTEGLSKQLQSFIDHISVENMDNQQQNEMYICAKEGLQILQMLKTGSIELEKLSIYKNILCLTHYQSEELTEHQLIGLFEFQKRGTIGVGFIKAIKNALSRNHQMSENKLNVLDMLVLSKYQFKSESEKISYHVFINKLMKFH